MAFEPDLDIAPEAEPVFVATLAAAAHCPPGVAAMNYQEVSEMTDLHRVEVFLELTEPGPNG